MTYRIRTKNRFDPKSATPYKLSRSRLATFLQCPRCFYLDRRLGIDRVEMPAFLLNSATDTLLKKEFDAHRAAGTPHPVFARHGMDAIPYPHASLEEWRNNFTGVQHHHEAANLLVFGAIDDLWQLADGAIAVVDYKSTSTTKPITLEGRWKAGYKRQMEIYQWLLRRNGVDVADTGYFLFVNADTFREASNERLVIDSQILPHYGDDTWVEEAITAAHACLVADLPAAANVECE